MTATAQIYLSYVPEDEEKVEKLYQKLSDAEYKPWMAKKDLLPGEHREYHSLKALQGSHFFLACLSENSARQRGFIQKEYRIALDVWDEKLMDDIYLIPVRLEDCEIPENLDDFQWVDLFEEDGWTRLLEGIRKGIHRLRQA